MNTKIITPISLRQFLWVFVFFCLMLGGALGLSSGHVAADAPCVVNGTTYPTSEHSVAVQIESHDAAGSQPQIGGAQVTESRTQPATCPNGPAPGDSNNFFVDDTGAPNHKANTATTTNSAFTIFWDSCFNWAPYFKQTPPPGDTFNYATVNAVTGTGVNPPQQVVYGGTQQDFQKAMTALWTQATQNGGSGYSIDLYYNVPPPGWTLTGGSAAPVNTQPGVPVTFSHAVTNSGPNAATYHWQVIGSYNGGSYSPSGLPSGDVSGEPKNGAKPDPSTNSYKFPPNANTNDRYCQEIEFTYPNGPGAQYPYGYSQPACTTLGSAPQPIDSGNCSIVNPPTTAVINTPINVDVQATNTGTAGPWNTSYYVQQTDSADTNTVNDPVSVIMPPNAAGDTADFYFSDKETATGSVTYNYSVWQEFTVGNGVTSSTVVIQNMCKLVVNWIEPPPVLGVNGASCTTIGGWASEYLLGATGDEDIDIYAYDNSSGPAGSAQPIASYLNDDTPYNNGAGNPSWSISIPPSYLDGQAHTFWIFATNQHNETTGPGSSFTYGGDPVTMPACAAFTTTGSTAPTLSPSLEDPSSYTTSSSVGITYGSGVVASFNPPITMTCTVDVTKSTAANPTPVALGTTQDCGGNFTKAPSTTSGPSGTISNPTAGDQYCSNVAVQYISGIVQDNGSGPGTVVSGTAGTIPAASCPTVHNEPFVHFLDGDVSAGGSFSGGSCSNPGGIYTYTNAYTNAGLSAIKTTGSGVQIGALSIGPIEGFNSASLHTDATGPYVAPTGLTFSNQVNTTGGTGSAPDEGGNLGGLHCIPDYWANMPTTGVTASTSSTIDLSSYAAGTTDVSDTPTGGTLNLSSGTNGIADGASIAIYVKGDVNITGDIFDHSTTDWTSPADIPSVYIIDSGGTIRVNHAVTQLDGIYVAEPDSSGNGGFINTCSSTATPTYNGNQLLTSCNNQLQVNGAFVAQQVYLNRSFGSLRDEKLSGGTVGVTGNPQVNGATAPLKWTGSAISGDSCAQMLEPSDNNWSNNYLCVPAGDGIGGAVQIGFTCDNFAANNPNGCNTPASASTDPPAGLPYCTPSIGSVINQSPWNYSLSATWSDNSLCSNDPITFVTGQANDPTSATQYCTQLLDQSDADGNKIWQDGAYICIQRGVAAVTGTLTSPDTLPSPLTCSNAGVQIDSSTCAAEIFKLSPEFYLNQPAIERTTGPTTGKYDFITSLSPVL